MTRDKSEMMKAGGAAIRARRLDCGLTQAELGAKAGVTAQAVGAWESGTSAPSASVRPDIAASLGVELFSSLYCRAPMVEEVPPMPSPLDYWCPTCGSHIGEPCSTRSGVYLKPSKSHAARKEGARLRGGR